MKRRALLAAVATVCVATTAFVTATGIRSALRGAREARAFCARSALELEASILAARIEAMQHDVVATERLFELEGGLHDARMLAAFGYAPEGRARRVSVRVSCDGAEYLPGSNGEAAWRALQETGLCRPAAPVPAPPADGMHGLLLQ